MQLISRTVVRWPYESIIDVLLHGSSRGRGRGRGARRRRYGGSDQSLLLTGVYPYILVTIGLHLRSVILWSRAYPRPRSFAMLVTPTVPGIVIYGAKTNVFVLRAPRSCLNRGIVMGATTQSTADSLTYYYRCRSGRAGRSDLKRRQSCVFG